MAAKGIVAILCALMPLSAACGGDPAARVPYTPGQYLKNYALSSCIADGYQPKEVVNDAVAASNGYKELGSLDIEAYNAAAVLGRQFLAKRYASQSGEKITLMKCIDFYHSRELDLLVRKYADQP